MVTTREFEDVVKQVNVMFDKLNKKIDKLEKQIGESSASKKTSKGKSKG